MNLKKDVAKTIATETKLKQWQADLIMDIVVREIKAKIVLGDFVMINGVGWIEREAKPAGTVYMPWKSPQYRNKPAKTVLKFRALPSMIEDIN